MKAARLIHEKLSFHWRQGTEHLEDLRRAKKIVVVVVGGGGGGGVGGVVVVVVVVPPGWFIAFQPANKIKQDGSSPETTHMDLIMENTWTVRTVKDRRELV